MKEISREGAGPPEKHKLIVHPKYRKWTDKLGQPQQGSSGTYSLALSQADRIEMKVGETDREVR